MKNIYVIKDTGVLDGKIKTYVCIFRTSFDVLDGNVKTYACVFRTSFI